MSSEAVARVSRTVGGVPRFRQRNRITGVVGAGEELTPLRRLRCDPLSKHAQRLGDITASADAGGYGVPKTADGTSEMIREIKIARDTAVKARTSAIITLKTLVVTAPDELRQELQPLSKARLRDRCAGLRPG